MYVNELKIPLHTEFGCRGAWLQAGRKRLESQSLGNVAVVSLALPPCRLEFFHLPHSDSGLLGARSDRTLLTDEACACRLPIEPLLCAEGGNVTVLLSSFPLCQGAG